MFLQVQLSNEHLQWFLKGLMAAFQAARSLQVTRAGQGMSENQQAESNVRETKITVLGCGSQKVRSLSMGAQGEPSPNTSL